MYGTVAKLKLIPGGLEALHRFETARKPEGFIGSHVYQSDQDPEDFWMIVWFKDKQSYFANAGSSAQDKEYREIAKFFKEEPEWHDGEVVFSVYS